MGVRPPDAAIVWAYLATFLAASVIDVGFIDRVGRLVLFQMLLKDFEAGPFGEGGCHGWRRRWGVCARLMRLPACLMSVSRLGLFVTAAAEPPPRSTQTPVPAPNSGWRQDFLSTASAKVGWVQSSRELEGEF